MWCSPWEMCIEHLQVNATLLALLCHITPRPKSLFKPSETIGDNLRQTTMWSDSTIVLSWIKSECWQYKGFMENWVSEIQDLVGAENWRYVDSNSNPAAVDITRRKTLLELSAPDRWMDGHPFLFQAPNQPTCIPLNVEVTQSPSYEVTYRDFDDSLCHAGHKRIFSEFCWCKWHYKSVIQKMENLPKAWLLLFKPHFWSIGVDSFSLYNIKIGRQHEKWWDIILKCLITKCMHLDLLCSMVTDSFMLVLRRFVARQKKQKNLMNLWSRHQLSWRRKETAVSLCCP